MPRHCLAAADWKSLRSRSSKSSVPNNRPLTIHEKPKAQSAKAFAPLDVVIQTGAEALDDAKKMAVDTQVETEPEDPAQS